MWDVRTFSSIANHICIIKRKYKMLAALLFWSFWGQAMEIVKKGRYCGAEAARFLSISTSAVNRLANEDELPEVTKIIS
jgi:hypothetical protein